MPILKEGELNVITNSADHTQKLGVCLGSLLQAGDVICLSGDMGAGKTMFSAGIGSGWGAFEPLTSPTFNLVHEHHRAKDQVRLFHIDCYRLRGSADLPSIGWEDILAQRGVIVIEWAEMILDALPKDHLWVELRVLESSRRNLIFEPHGDRYHHLMKEFLTTNATRT